MGPGFVAGVGLEQVVVSDDYTEYTGTGFGVQLGYDLGDFGLFADVGAATVSEDGGEEDIEGDASFYNVGARYAFDAPGRRFVPYFQLSYSNLSISQEYCDFGCVEGSSSAGGLGFGGGLRVFFTPSLALDGGVRFGTGAFSEIEVDGETFEFEDENGFVLGRFVIGVTYRGGRGEGGGGTGRTTTGGPK